LFLHLGSNYRSPGLNYGSVVIYRVSLQVLDIDELETSFVRRRQHDLGSHAILQCLLPSAGYKAPAIAFLQTRKCVLWHRRGEVIPRRFGVSQKLLGRHDAHGMAAGVLNAGLAVTVSKKACHRVGTAGLQISTEYIPRFGPLRVVTVSVAVGNAHFFALDGSLAFFGSCVGTNSAVLLA